MSDKEIITLKYNDDIVQIERLFDKNNEVELVSWNRKRGSNTKSLEIPLMLPGDFKIVSLSVQCFYKSKYEHITIPEGVRSIDGWAFQSSAIKTIKLPNTLVRLGFGAFDKCSNLIDVVIPDKIEGLASSLFENCRSLKKVTLPKNLKEIGPFVFHRCYSLTEINLPDTIEVFGPSSFDNCTNLTEFHWPENLEEIKQQAFYNCGIKKAILNKKLNSIELEAFDSASNLEEVDFTNIEKPIALSSNVFNNCPKLKYIKLREDQELDGGYFNDGMVRHCDNFQGVIIDDCLYQLTPSDEGELPF